MKYKYFLFDLDGVLSNTDIIQFNSTREAIIKSSNFDILQNEEITQIFKSTITTQDKLCKLVDFNIITKYDIEPIYEEKKIIADNYFKLLEKDYEKIKLFDYLKKNNCKIAVITNGNKTSAELILKNIGVFEYVDLLISNNDVINKKPHSEPYIRAMLFFKGQIEEYIIFEDSECGLKSAYGTGCKIVEINNVNDVNINLIYQFLD
jgi:beta-phosphoglucomutase-like phosphatase (HAD superfamily)